MKSLMLKALALGVIGIVVSMTVAMVPVALADQSSIITQPACNDIKGASGSISGCTSGQQLETKGGLVAQIVNTALFAAGIVALVFVFIGGFRYIASTGDSTRIQAAKDTLLYAIIGLAITIVAVPIADFVIAKVAGG